MHDETRAVHSGHTIDANTGAVTPSIQLSTTFERQPDGSYPQGYKYSRTNNPNRQALEDALAALEGGAAAAAFASGSAAMTAILQSLRPGDHVIAPEGIYYGIREILRTVFVPWGLAVTFVDMTDQAALWDALRRTTRLVIVETPSNPLLKITNLVQVSAAAHEAGAVVVCDNTLATPILQQPFKFGVDLILHATTKYLGGHSDVMGGVVVSREDGELFQRFRHVQTLCGAIPSPFECWLAVRGIQTLPYRIRAQSETALQVAQFLQTHPAVEAVYYPGLPSHAGHDVARQQMAAYGGVLSFLVRGSRAEAMAAAGRAQLFIRATSFGGTHSLIEHRASMEAPDTKTPDTLLRLSIGLEHAADLIADLEQALAASKA